ncbi:hypothetical protein [Chengkuizengella axinellae]|uniref:Uncharacterized protein n=1 Tax=Chengkuizengella axinellae TaxID=3064388 RepID=A0ABT9J1L4_9BACL|nr:hypothetical protein [Chengkuizengella sp. 2205SS18-9]MDP5275497.1 hypothetical protein [Chengkuizengella sp. 2205SS18-9]
MTPTEEVILETKICVKEPNKTVKLDWSVQEQLTANNPSTGGNPVTLNLDTEAEYTLCKNDQIIEEGTVASSFSQSTTLEISGDESFTLSSSIFTQDNRPNLTFCDTPVLGMNCYQVKARLVSNDAISSATVSRGTLNVVLSDH